MTPITINTLVQKTNYETLESYKPTPDEYSRRSQELFERDHKGKIGIRAFRRITRVQELCKDIYARPSGDTCQYRDSANRICSHLKKLGTILTALPKGSEESQKIRSFIVDTRKMLWSHPMSSPISRAEFLLEDDHFLMEFQQDSPQWIELLINAISQDPWFIERIPTTFPEYEWLCIKAIETNPSTFAVINKKTPQIYRKMVQRHPSFLQENSEACKGIWVDLINVISQDPWFIERIPTTLPEYERLCIKAIEINPGTFAVINKKTPQIYRKMVQRHPSFLQENPEACKGIWVDLIEAAVTNNTTTIPLNFLEKVPQEVISSTTDLPTGLLVMVLQKQPRNLRHIPIERADYETLALKAIEIHLPCITAVPLKRRTPQMYEKAFDRTKTDGKFNLALLPDPAISLSIDQHPTLPPTEKMRLKNLAEEQRQNAKVPTPPPKGEGS